MPKSIVVVDDEKLVVFGICSLLADNKEGYEISATCNSGEEGLKSCIENPPDLLLTDIGMPGIGGLGLIGCIKKTNPEIKVLVLSCHDEYDLVHRAFMLGADDYILKKDIDRDKLLQLLNRMLPERIAGVGKHEDPKIITPLSADNDFIPEKPGSLGVIGFKSEKFDENTNSIWQPDIPMLMQLISREVLPHGRFYLGLYNDLVMFFPEMNLGEKTALTGILEKTRRMITKYVNRKVFIANYIMKTSESIMQGYNRSLKILDGLFYHSKSRVLTEMTSEHKLKTSLSFEVTETDFRNCWSEALSQFLTEAERKNINPGAVRAELIFAVEHLLHHLRENTEEDICSSMMNPGRLYSRKISEFNDITCLKSWTEDFLDDIADEIKDRRVVRNAVFKAKQYVNTNLRKDLRLGTVATVLGINANHLSTIFKKSTGENYIEYVNRKRVEHARELLETTDYTAKEIAFRCGYCNPNYFSRIFKKLTKETISEYRSECNNNL